MNITILQAGATLIGTIIGAGILGIPYAVSKVGFLPGIVMLIILSLAMIILQLMFAEITLRTKHKHQIPGYGGFYLGYHVKRLSLMIGLLAGYGTLLAYMIGEGTVLSSLFGGSSLHWGLAFFVVGSVIVYKGLDIVKRFELGLEVFVLLIVTSIGVLAWPHIKSDNVYYWNLSQMAVPYGVLLFALSGTIVIPQIRQELIGQEKKLPVVIIGANLIVFLVYALFLFFVVGVTGKETTELATVGLGIVVGRNVFVLGNILAFFTMSTSFLAIGIAMRSLFQFDYGFSREKALLATILVPLALFVLGARDFISVLGLVGGVLLSIQSAIVIFAFWKSLINGNRKPEFKLGVLSYTGFVLLIIFIIGAVLTLFNVSG
ncbi:hypothetical protein A3F34_00560 [Candidatus Roizmanbacteria bacterium RIFCSPHIGHO2_12_FULL_44_10]|uniref:Amino acid transporter transmembrane domain-containing protein n=1 Tax=Candidatus Roizmanbacteria bacterium RIFCSPHIGHO2_12_FULL_44_10 TaxID=1802054 RepID=A0A1F7I636_9BACT|nr:MAG: hypothetical protein A3F34_00560 [Candidatus Roizmanbacteria bacterium RIFCSPHIGHO2_12_FULL_44_10]